MIAVVREHPAIEAVAASCAVSIIKHSCAATMRLPVSAQGRCLFHARIPVLRINETACLVLCIAVCCTCRRVQCCRHTRLAGWGAARHPPAPAQQQWGQQPPALPAARGWHVTGLRVWAGTGNIYVVMRRAGLGQKHDDPYGLRPTLNPCGRRCYQPMYDLCMTAVCAGCA